MPAGLTYTSDGVASSVATITVGDHSPTEVWQDIAANYPFQRAVVRGIRESASGMFVDEYREKVWSYDLPMGVGELAVRIAQGEEDAPYQLAYALERIGEGWTEFDHALAVPKLMSGDEKTPTIGVTLTSDFFNRRKDHRVDICRLLCALAEAFDVRVISSGYVRHKLAKTHREDLPGVTDACSTHRDGSPLATLVDEARATLNPDGREVRLLREVADTPAENRSYHELEANLPFDRSSIRVYTKTLSDHSLVETFTTGDGTHVELLKAGSALLDAIDADIGRQSSLDTCVSDAGNSCKYSRVNPNREGDGGGVDPTAAAAAYADRRERDALVEVEYMPRWRQAAAQGAATEGHISLIDLPEGVSNEIRQPFLGYNEEALVVGAEYVNPMQYWVCVARALADRRVWDNVLTPERLDGEVGNLGGLLTDDTRLLRDARCLGWLKDQDANGEDFGQALMDAEDELLTLTRRYHNEDYECSTEDFRGIITRHALGMAGTVAHLCDLADVELVRELRLGEFSRRFGSERREALAETVVRGAQIQSRHGHFAAYRQLFEGREEKRSGAMSPSIPADNPTGGMIGSFVISGQNASGFAEMLRKEFKDSEPHEDAPEFDVRVPIGTSMDRANVAETARRMLQHKNLKSTRMANALFDGLAGTVYDVAKAISQLAAEDEPRDIRLDEVRVALSRLSPKRLLPAHAPSVRKLVSALLTAAMPLSRTELAEKADISTRSVRTHLPTLEALGLASTTNAGIRFELPFATGEERGRDIVPGLVTDAVVSQPIDIAADAVEALLGDEAFDPEHPVGAAFFESDPFGRLREHPDIGPWVRLIGCLSRDGATADPLNARFGPSVDQIALPESVLVGAP